MYYEIPDKDEQDTIWGLTRQSEMYLVEEVVAMKLNLLRKEEHVIFCVCPLTTGNWLLHFEFSQFKYNVQYR